MTWLYGNCYFTVLKTLYIPVSSQDIIFSTAAETEKSHDSLKAIKLS